MAVDKASASRTPIIEPPILESENKKMNIGN
jgi:hypothetical protein